ncbi:MAG: hypothetical protein JNL58_23460 [Planctomyces sp.]|nr:hypothetical protein [Planctomyces sp.]
MSRSRKHIYGSLSLAICLTGSGCAGQQLRQMFSLNRTAEYKTLEELESGGSATDETAVASADDESTAEPAEKKTLTGRLVSWSPFGNKDKQISADGGSADQKVGGDPFLAEGSTVDEDLIASGTRGADSLEGSTRNSVDKAVEETSAETEKLFASLNPPAKKSDRSLSKKTEATSEQKTALNTEPKATKNLDAFAELTKQKSTERTAAKQALADLDDLLGIEPENESVESGDQLLADDDRSATAVPLFDSKAKVERPFDSLRRSAPAPKAPSAFDALISESSAAGEQVNRIRRTVATAEKQMTKAESDFFGATETLQAAAKGVAAAKDAADRDPFAAAAEAAKAITDDSAFQWNSAPSVRTVSSSRPLDGFEELDSEDADRSARGSETSSGSVFSHATFQNQRPISNSSLAALDVPAAPVSASGTEISGALSASGDPFFGAGPASPAAMDVPVDTVAAGNSVPAGFWRSFNLRNVILVVGGIIVVMLLFVPNRKENA